jgi:hypothetical protein
MSTAELVRHITVPAGLFFLLLLLIACFLPWVPRTSGFEMRDAGILWICCLLVAAAVGFTYLWPDLLPRVAAGAAGFGVFAFIYMLAEVIRCGRFGGAQVGVWLGFVAALFIAGAFVTLAVFRPLELAGAGAPFLKRFGALLIAVGTGVTLGVVYLLLTALA